MIIWCEKKYFFEWTEKHPKKQKVIKHFKNIITFEVLRILTRYKDIKFKTLYVGDFYI